MAFTQLSTDLNNHQSLADRPNQDNGLTAAQLKTLYDKAANDIKTYINSTLLVELARTTDGSAGADNVGATAITDLAGTTVQAILESIRNTLKSVTDSSSGADFIGATTISGVTGATVQAVLEGLKSYVDTQNTTQDNNLNTHKSSSDHDGRYYTETELNNGQLNNLYYTETEMNDYSTTAASGSKKVGVKSTYRTNVQEWVTYVESNGLVGAIPADLSVVEGKIASNAVTETKIANNAVISAKLSTTLYNDIYTPTYQASATATQQIIPLSSTALKSRMEVALEGNTEVNVVKNGNFANGDNWAPTAGTESVSANIYSLTGDGSAANVLTTQDTAISVVNAKKVYVRALAKVTNASASSIALKVVGSTAGTETTIKSQATPTNGTWYLLDGVLTTPNDFTGVYRINIYQTYADAATANTKVLQVQQVMAIDLTSRYGAGSEPDAATCALRYANWFDGVKSTDRQIVKSVGKNLFNKSTASLGSYVSITTGDIYADTVLYTSDYIKVKQSTQYVTNGTSGARRYAFYDSNKNIISGQVATDTFTTTANTFYLKISDSISTINAKQLELGSTATTYEAYTETSAIAPVELKKISSTIKDTFDANSGKYTKNVEVDLDISSTKYASQDASTYTNVDVIKTTAFSLMKTPTTGVDGIITLFNKDGKRLEEVTQANIDLVASAGKYYLHTDKTVWFIVAADTYADVAAARTGLGTSKIFYQLATPVITNYYPNTLTAEPNGTIYTYPFVADYDFYDGGCAITNTTYPINSLEYVNIVNKVTGALTPVALTTCTVASGGLSFTSTGITAEDLVDFGYTHKDLSTVADVTYSYASNLKGTVDGNTKSIADLDNKVEQVIAKERGKINVATVTLGAISATTTFGAFIAPTDCEIADIKLVTKDAITASDTNYWTITAYNKGASGSGTDKIAEKTTKTTGGTAFAAYDAWDLGAIDATYGKLKAGDVVILTLTKTASATAFAEAFAVIGYIKGN